MQPLWPSRKTIPQMSEQLPSVLGMGVGEVTPEPGSLQAVERRVPGVCQEPSEAQRGVSSTPALQLSAVCSHFRPHVLITVAPLFRLDAGEHVEVPSWLGLIFKVFRNLTRQGCRFFPKHFPPPNSNPNHHRNPCRCSALPAACPTAVSGAAP